MWTSVQTHSTVICVNAKFGIEGVYFRGSKNCMGQVILISNMWASILCKNNPYLSNRVLHREINELNLS